MSEEFSLKLKVDSTETAKGAKSLDDLAAAGAKADTANESLLTSSRAVGSAVGLLAVAATAALGGLALMARNAINAADAMNDLHIKTGLAFRDLAAYDLLASQSGASIQGVAQGFKNLGAYMVTHSDKLKTIGVDSKNVNVAMGQFADVIAGIQDPALKSALAMTVLKRGGTELLPMLSGGSAAFKLAREQSEAYGLALEKVAPKADAFNDMLARMATGSKVVGLTIADKLLPTLIALADIMLQSSTNGGLFEKMGETAAAVLKGMAVAAINVVYVFRQVGDSIGGTAAKFAAILTGDFARVGIINKEMDTTAQALRAEVDQMTSSILNAGVGSAEAAAGTAAYNKALEDAARKLVMAKQAADAHQKSINSMLASLQKAADTYGMTSAQIKMYEADHLRMSKKEFERARDLIGTVDAAERAAKAEKKLAKMRTELADIATKATTANEEHISNLQMENSLIGKSVLQQQLLRSEYQSNLALKKEFAEIDKKVGGLHDIAADNAAIAKLQSASDARIKMMKDEAQAKLDATYQANVTNVMQVGKNPLFAQVMGEDNIQAEMTKRKAAAEAAHADAMTNISDLDTIYQKEMIARNLKSEIAANEAKFADKEMLIAEGRKARAVEIEERIRTLGNATETFGSTNAQFIEAENRLLEDRELNEIRGLEITREKLFAANEFAKAEADAATAKLRVSKDQLEYDNANATLQATLVQLARDATDTDAISNVGLEYQAKWQAEQVERLSKQLVLDKALLENGKLTNEQLKEQATLQKQIAEIKNTSDAGKATKDALEAQAKARQLKEQIILESTAAKQAQQDLIKSIESDFHGSMLRLLEQGKTGWAAMTKAWKNSLKVNVFEYLYKELAKPYVLKIIASIVGAVGTSGVASAAGEAMGGAIAGGSSTSSWLTIAKTGWDLLAGGFEAFGAGVTSFLDGIGTSLIGASDTLSEAGFALLDSSSAIGTAASYIGAAAAGITIGTFLAGDKALFGMDGLTTSLLGTAIGLALAPVFGPLGVLFGGIIGGGLNALFGMGEKEYQQSTVRGGFSGKGFKGAINTHWTQEGGFFRSDKEGDDTTALTDPAQQFLNGIVAKSGAAFARLISVSGDAARSVDGWAFAIDRALPDEEAMTKLFNEMADSMGTYVIPELEKFRAKGENLADTAVRMGDEYIITNSIFKMLGFTTAETGLASLGMRDSLIQLMGGIQETSATMDSYYKNFYTADEQHINSLNQVNDAFKILGLTAPTTREEFRALAETLIKDTTPAGQALFVAVMKLNPAFAAVTQSTEDLVQSAKDLAQSLIDLQGRRDTLEIRYNTLQGNSARALMLTRQIERAATDESNHALLDLVYAQEDYNKALDNAKKAVTEAFAGIQRSVARERDVVTKAYQASLDKVAASVTSVTATVDKLKTLSNALKQTVAGINPPTRAQAQAQILTALTIAKASGVLPTAESLSGALQTLAEPSEKMFSTFLQWQADQRITVRNISELADMSDTQISVQDRQLLELEATRKVLEGTQTETMELLDGILTRAEMQIAGMNAVETSVFSVATAVDGMTDAVNAFLRVLNKEPGFVGNESPGSGTGPGGAANGTLQTDSEVQRAIKWANEFRRLNHMPALRNQDPVGDMEYWQLVARNRRQLVGTEGAGYKMPSFATGTDFVPQDMIARIHQGEAIIPKAFNRNNAATNAELVSIVKELIAVVKAGDAAIAINTGESAKYARRWDGYGILVRAETTTPLPVRQTA